MPTTILIVDDVKYFQYHIQVVLESSGICEKTLVAADGCEAIEVLGREDVDLVLCDVMMPQVDGFEFLSRQKDELERREIPVIMLTAEGGVDSKVWCFEAGASDYLVKPFDDVELVARVKLHLQLKTLRAELKRTNQELAELACLDSLTRVSSRRHFLESLGRELRRAAHHVSGLVLAKISIDGFQRVNDDHGRQIGDQALAQVAQRLRSSLRDYDLLARYRGGEFAVVFVDAKPEAALVGAERCCRLVAGERFKIEDQQLEITISVGLVVTSGADSVDELIQRADEALCAAKEQGRNRVVLAEC